MRRMRYWLAGLGVAGLLIGCGGGDDSAEGDGSDRRPTEQASEDGQERESSTSSTAPSSTTTTAPAPPRVVYEVTGAGTVIVSYATAANPLQDREVTLPWSEEQAEEPARLSMLVALTGSQGDVTCRIRRGDEVLAEATLASGAGPLLNCDYPPSGVPPATYPPGM